MEDTPTPAVTVLSIDAWRYDGGWNWNNWFRRGTIDVVTLEGLKTNRQILRWMRQHGYLSAYSAGKVAVEDDQYNLVIVAKGTREPLFAIAYGEAHQ